MRLLLLLLLSLPLAATETSFDAKWKRRVRPDVVGSLRVGDDYISFHPRDRGLRTLTWHFEDIQHIDRRSPTEIALQSYADSFVRPGRDRWYRFVLVDGTFDDELHAQVTNRVGKPATDRLVREPDDAEISIPAKRMQFFGGMEGMLYFTPDRILFLTEVEGGSRAWHLDRDVETVWSSDPFRVEVHVLGSSESFVRRVEIFRFSLKRPLDASYYARLRTRLYDLRRDR